MQLIYSKDGSPVDGLTGYYRNPEHFRGCERGATQVTVDATFAQVADAYQALGVDVTLLGDEPSEDDQPKNPGKSHKGKKSETPDEPDAG